METLQLKAYAGKDIDPDNYGDRVIFIGVFYKGKLEDCVCATEDEFTRMWMGSNEHCITAINAGMVDTGAATPIAQRFLDQPDNVLLWEAETEGTRVQHTAH